MTTDYKTLKEVMNGRSFYELEEYEVKSLAPELYRGWVAEHLENLWDGLSDEDKSEFAPAVTKGLGVEIKEYPNWQYKEESDKRKINPKAPEKTVAKRRKFKYKIWPWAKQRGKIKAFTRKNIYVDTTLFLLNPFRWAIYYRHQAAKHRFKKFLAEHRDCI